MDRTRLGRRGARLESAADQRGHLLDSEAEELDALDDAVAAQVGEGREERLVRLVLPVGADHEESFGEVAAHEPAQQSQRRPVGPLQIVQDEEEPVAGDAREPFLERGRVEPAFADRVREGLVRHERLLGAAAVEHGGALCGGLDCEPRGQPRLAAARLAGDEADAHALALAIPEVQQPCELARPPDEELRVDSAKLRRHTFGRSVGAKRFRNAPCLVRRPHPQGLEQPRPEL